MVDIHPFDNPEYIAEALNKFNARNWTVQQFHDMVYDYRNLFRTIPTYPVTIKKDTVIFRGRPNEGEEDFKELKDLGIKPSRLVKSYGRAHIPHLSAFYASSNEETVAREVTQWYVNDNGRAQDLITKGIMGMNWNPFTSFMTISAWHVKEDLTLALLFNADSKNRSTYIQECEKDYYNIAKGNENRLKSRKLILDFFSNEFGRLDVKHESEYLFSAFYASEVYAYEITESQDMRFDSVKFASIANENRGENYAIKESSFKTKLEFLGANSCYTYNNNRINPIEGEGTAMIGHIKTARLLLDEQSLNWIDATDEADYWVKVDNDYLPWKLPPTGSRFPKAVKRIST
jgi:hypothetical protein